MLFTSAAFACVYLPLVWAGFFAVGRYSGRGAAIWLFLASLAFYGYWMPEFTFLLVGSIVWNYWIGKRIGQLEPGSGGVRARRYARRWLILGIGVNLGLLAYFKYANFFLANVNAVFGLHWSLGTVILPIGISFFTFTQIAFLADTYQKGTREYAFPHYGLFVTYFPHLIAGPVLHHAQMMPQFREAATYRVNMGNVTGGLLIFAMGLAKKVILADGISPYADAVFNGAQAGAVPDGFEAWVGALAYTFQLYFDFSGYSDMAVGLSWMFNVKLPYNFDSPYKAVNITEFWRRWHMTLSAFLRDYLYIPLGGNRRGASRRYVNLMATMVLGGLWHGANWTFVFWGFLHGLYLGLNHAFQALSRRARWPVEHRLFRLGGWLVTFLAVVVAWVFFRAADFSSAWTILRSLIEFRSLEVDATHPLFWNQGLDAQRGLVWLAVLAGMAFLLPNSNRLGERALALVRHDAVARPLLLGCALLLAGFVVLINTARDTVSAFIYFNF